MFPEKPPIPNSPNTYYLFNIGVPGFVDTVYYALIDMNLNGGLGAVVQKNVPFDHYSAADCLTAIKHGNGRDWWIVNKLGHLTTNTNQYYVYLIDSFGISPRISQNFNDAHDVDFQKLVMNSNGTRFIQINFRGYMAEYAFDRCTGIITQLRTIYPETSNGSGRFFWEAAYSPNDSLFYVSTAGTSVNDVFYLLQYNLMAPDVPASSDTLDSFSISTSGISAGAVRLAPDGKIYFSRAYESLSVLNYPYPDSMRNYINENLSVINQPNNLGAACDYQPFSFYLGGKRTYYGLPNNPNYSLGPLVGSPCDTLYVATSEILIPNIRGVLYPNPAVDNVTLKYQNNSDAKIIIKIQDKLGQLLSSYILYGNEITFSTGNYTQGVYQVTIYENGVNKENHKLILIK